MNSGYMIKVHTGIGIGVIGVYSSGITGTMAFGLLDCIDFLDGNKLDLCSIIISTDCRTVKVAPTPICNNFAT